MSTDKKSKHWQKPQTAIYEHNYGYGMNFYQPMIDYIDNKKVKGKVEYPHLPYTNERGLEKYRPGNLIKSYTDADLQRFVDEEKFQTSRNKGDLDLASQVINATKGASKYSLQKTVSAAAVQKVRVEAVMKKTKKRKSKKSETTEETDIMPYGCYDYDPESDRQAELALKKIKKYMRGKSAYAIEQALLKESNKNINENILQDMNYSHNIQTKGQQSFKVRRAHVELMDSRMTDQLNQSFTEPLNNLRGELQGLDRKTAINMESQR